MALQVELVSPERVVLETEADMVRARTIGGGDIAFLSGHAPFLGALDTATITIRPAGGGNDIVAAVHGGFISVNEDVVRVLSDLAELAADIDTERARRAEERAQDAVRRGDDTEAEAALRRAHARLTAVGGI
ncbi:MAG: F0F1 ATP synthase subunit epsilon [Acidimicrobiia bacterium]|nr:F0F1 ATP synthase subunit epsilon [Acidimicrobiia bacterium]